NTSAKSPPAPPPAASASTSSPPTGPPAANAPAWSSATAASPRRILGRGCADCGSASKAREHRATFGRGRPCSNETQGIVIGDVALYRAGAAGSFRRLPSALNGTPNAFLLL